MMVYFFGPACWGWGCTSTPFHSMSWKTDTTLLLLEVKKIALKWFGLNLPPHSTHWLVTRLSDVALTHISFDKNQLWPSRKRSIVFQTASSAKLVRDSYLGALEALAKIAYLPKRDFSFCVEYFEKGALSFRRLFHIFIYCTVVKFRFNAFKKC